ncbi:hypothetical protein [Arthrobacter sp. TB 23]|uniref:hypothetical protein n=1 Tax=Arthrobacter sp. TB 23 TaxID=494419 RepID=UPI0012EAF1B7|nr:hypothetical protein [Arthrobacter sp. TB 23]
MGALIFPHCTVGAVYFGIGRSACPRAERLPRHELDHGDVLATLRCGWHALGQHSALARVMGEMQREHR